MKATKGGKNTMLPIDVDELGFGNCTNTRACELECPKGVKISHIARLNREFLKANFSD